METPKVHKSVPLAEQAYEILKEMIVSTQIKPGDTLMENQLASSLGISRSPLREALARLERDGFVETEPWKGTHVRPLRAQFVFEVFEVRMALECMAARKSAAAITGNELDELERQFEIVGAALDRGDAAPFYDSDSAFHDVYIRGSGNELLQEIMAWLSDHMARIRAYSEPLLEHTKAAFAEHRQILAAMRTRDPDALESAVHTHLLNNAKRLGNAVKRASGE